MYCTQCGTEMAAGSNFCPNCGSAVAGQAGPLAEGLAPGGSRLVGRSSRAGPWWLAVAIACAVVLAAGGGAFWLLRARATTVTLADGAAIGVSAAQPTVQSQPVPSPSTRSSSAIGQPLGQTTTEASPSMPSLSATGASAPTGSASRMPAQPVAERVYGQPDFTSDVAGDGNITGLIKPSGVAVDAGGKLYVTDVGGVRLYASGSTTSVRRILVGANNTSVATVSSLPPHRPPGVATGSGGDLYVADPGNNRVLFFVQNFTKATRIYGQPDFTTNRLNNGGVSATSLSRPGGVAVDGIGNVYIVDSGNSRVLFYPRGSTTATRVYGQPDLGSGLGDNGGVSATSLSDPGGVALDASGNLYVADTANNRVLFYPKDSTRATRVYGQSDLASYTANRTEGRIGPKASAISLWRPQAVAVDGNGNLNVADTGNNRVLFFSKDSTTAERVYGQPDFSSNAENNGGLSARSLRGPSGVAVDASGNLYVADTGNDRVLRNMPFATPFTLPAGSQATGTASAGPQPQATLTVQQQRQVDQMKSKLPDDGSFFSLNFDSQSKHFSLTLDEQYQQNGDQEFDLFLRANGIDDRSWLVPLDVAIRQCVGKLGRGRRECGSA